MWSCGNLVCICACICITYSVHCMYHVHWHLYHAVPSHLMVQGPEWQSHMIASRLVHINVHWSAMHHLVVQGPVPYDRISPVRIPPLLSGAALTLHPPSLQYISSFSLGLFTHMIFTPNILCESDFWGQVGFQLTKLTYIQKQGEC